MASNRKSHVGRRDRWGNCKLVYLNPDLQVEVQAWAIRHGATFSRALEILALIGLAAEQDAALAAAAALDIEFERELEHELLPVLTQFLGRTLHGTGAEAQSAPAGEPA